MYRLIKCILPVFILLTSCNKLEYSPNQQFDRNSPANLNVKNIARIQAGQTDDTIRFVLCGDTQRSYNNAAEFVRLANSIPGLDFVILDGDISDFGLLLEMEEINKRFSELTVPYVALIGNHDLADNGERIYKSMYGRLDFSFIYQGVKFICHNSNSREFNFNGKVPDLNWLNAEINALAPGGLYVAVAHVPPLSEDFDQSLKDSYLQLVQTHSGSLGSLYAHTGKTETFYPAGINGPPLITTGGIDNRQFSIITIVNGKLSSENTSY